MSKFQKGSIVKVRESANPKWIGLTGEVLWVETAFKNTSYKIKIESCPGWERKEHRSAYNPSYFAITFHHPNISSYAIPTVWKESKLTWTDNQILVDA